MTTLNLPKIQAKISQEAGKAMIFDVVRKKYIILTPEEWVRQHFSHYLINSLNYPKSLMKIEGGLTYNKLAKRSDIVVYNQTATPHILVECKSFKIALSQRVLEQVSIYNQTLRADYLAVTNGLHHLFFHVDFTSGKANRLDSLPEYKKPV